MKKYIPIVVMVIVTLMSLIYGTTQNMEANRWREIAEANAKEAEKQHALAANHMRMAEANAAEAMRQNQLLQEELKKYKKK